MMTLVLKTKVVQPNMFKKVTYQIDQLLNKIRWHSDAPQDKHPTKRALVIGKAIKIFT